jgi:hypothetical protein
MAGERNYLRVPPDSSGKRVRLKHSAQLTYTGKTLGYQWKSDNYYTLTTSGWEIHVHEIHETSTTSGILDISYDSAAEFNNLAPASGEGIRDQATNQVIATADTVIDIFNNTTNIVGFENPTNGLDIDNTGSANIRFYEGNPQLDAFGKLRVSGATLLGDYVFTNSYLPIQFSTNMANGANVSWDSNKRAALLSNPTTSGALVAHTSNTYHHYTPGSSHLFMATLALGDSGKQNVGRAWGLFDFQNGFHFVHREYPLGSGEYKLGIVIKSDVTGSTVDTYVWQDDWNIDKLDGTGRSQMVIDVTKDNLYWLDVQWLGAGRARFGVYHNGQRVTCHEYYHDNRFPQSISATASLPVCFSQRNFGTTGSSSEMRIFCAAVWTESPVDTSMYGQPGQEIISKTITSNDTYAYLGTMTPVELYENGRTNRTLYFPTTIDVQAFDTTTGEDVRVELEIKAESVLSNTVFAAQTIGSSVLIDSSGTYHGGGRAIFKALVKGSANLDLTSIYSNMTTGAVKNYSENGGHRHVPISSISNSSPAVITVNYPQLRHRQGNRIGFMNLAGMTQLNNTGEIYYVKPTGLTTAELYTDSSLTTPLDTTTFGVHTAGTGEAQGFYGAQYYWSLVVKKYYGTNPAKIIVKIGWKEVTQ